MKDHAAKICGLLACAGCGVSTASAQPVFRPLGFPSGRTTSYALAISADGQTVAGTTMIGSSGATAWWWRIGTGMSSISGAAQQATGVSGDGSLISVITSDFPPRTLRYETATNSSTELPFFGGGYFAAHCLSADGLAFGGEVSVPPHAHDPGLWTAASGPIYVQLTGGYDSGSVYAVSADGSVAAGWGYAYAMGTGPAFRWTAATGAVSLGFLGSSTFNSDSVATGISSDGSVIVGWSDLGPDQRGFRWTAAGGMVEIGPVPGSPDLLPAAVSGDGSVVVGSYSGGTFIWDAAHGARDLRQELVNAGAFGPVSLWGLSTASAISADGRWVAGTGVDELGRTQAYVVDRAVGMCYANCDGSTTYPQLNVADFTCFLRRFAAGDSYANCDTSTGSPQLNVADFTCFLQRFVVGCS